MNRMDDVLYKWLYDHWRTDNHAKYQHYFEPWVNNITNSQIEWFKWQMDHELRKANWIKK